MNPSEQRRAQALALAAVLEAATLVDQLARTGSAPANEMEALAASLFCFEWQSVEEIFGGVAPLRRGVALLERVLGQLNDAGQSQVLRYTLALLHLGRRLARDRALLERIRERLAHTRLEAEHFSNRFDELATSIAAIYQDTISTYDYRIQVTGSTTHLQDPRVAAAIRTLLLAGLRATVLWRHVGGGLIGTLFGRAALLDACRKLAATG